MTNEEKLEIQHIISEEIHHLDESHGWKRVEQIISIAGLVLAVLAVLVGLDVWSPLPPVAAEVIKAMR